MIGTLAVAISAYLAAVYLAADARRFGERGLERDFRLRALWSGVVAGALALAGLLVMRADARSIWDGLTSGAGLVMVVVSAAAGLATLLLVWHSRFGPARASAALAVAAIVAGWALAQRPYFLPGLTVSQAAAGRSTLVAVVVTAVIGALVLVPSLILLFWLFLGGRLDAGPAPDAPALDVRPGAHRRSPRLVGAFALVSLLAGVGLMVLSDAGWAHAVGIACLVAFAASTFNLAATTPLEEA
jgi:cytochrome d ubiquinol oxidase subunit II